ncbi:MAG TPA: carbohydrate kinase family protein [Candidatus Deferrimicrobium sp.]|nr:carbohydrate kinase family protein [Candidatus Deferrimicrobium sp.]
MKDVVAIGAALVDMVALIEKFPGIDEEVFVPKLELMGGGSAANFAVACARLGLKTGFIGKLGKDAFGEKLIDEFQKENVEIEGIVVTTEVQTGVCYAAVDKQGNRILYAFSGAANFLQPSDIDEEYLKIFRVIHLASLKNIKPLIRAAEIVQWEQTRVCLNPGALIVDQGLDKVKPLLELIDIFIGSQGEVKRLFQTENLSKGLRSLLEYVEIAVITQGNEGSLIVTQDGEIKIPAEQIKVVDTTGAGDAFSAGFIYGLLRYNFDPSKLELCGKIGNKAAAHCIQQVGARQGLLTEKEMISIIEQLNTE